MGFFSNFVNRITRRGAPQPRRTVSVPAGEPKRAGLRRRLSGRLAGLTGGLLGSSSARVQAPRQGTSPQKYDNDSFYVVEAIFEDVRGFKGIPFSRIMKGEDLNRVGDNLEAMIELEAGAGSPPIVNGSVEIERIVKL